MPKKKTRRRNNRRLNRKRTVLFAVVLLLGLLAAGVYQYARYRYDNRFHTFSEFAYNRNFPIRGVDASHHNTFIDWRQLKMDNVTFAYLKSTEGTDHKDRNYRENYRLAMDAGLKVGTYHFYTFGKDGNEQALHFLRNSKVKSGDLVPAIDVEHSKINKLTCNEDDLVQMIDELKKLEATLFRHFGKHPVIYTNKQCFKMYIENNFPYNPLWICDLHGEPTERFGNWQIWQFSHTGTINGVTDHIDLNYYRGSAQEFENLLIP